MSKDNMKFWDSVEKSDPKYVKEVSLGRTFSAIDPMYQIKNATSHMGICGEGWGFEVVETLFLPIDCVAVRIRLWKEKKEQFVEQWGQCKLYTDKNKTKPDNDCMKKATTDGLTKCLSLLGFNADVFLNKFSDNKYVEELLQQQAQDEKRKEAIAWTDKYMKRLEDCKDEGDLTNLETETTKVGKVDVANTKMVNGLKERQSDLFTKIDDKTKELREQWQSSQTSME